MSALADKNPQKQNRVSAITGQNRVEKDQEKAQKSFLSYMIRFMKQEEGCNLQKEIIKYQLRNEADESRK